VLLEGLGGHQRIVGCSPDAQRWFDQGLDLAYAFNANEALRSFRRAAELDTGCGMASWGIAYAAGPDINATAVTSERAAEGYRAAQAALGRAASASPADRALIEAMAARWSKDTAADRKALDRAWAEAMRAVRQAQPRDADVAALTAQALMQLNPWRLWSLQGQPGSETAEVLEDLEAALAIDASHPLANHLYIHASEASPAPGRADAAAQRLRELAPESPHLLHMSSHIDVRTGRWAAAIASNQRAIEADQRYRRAQPAAEPGAGYPAHNQHMLAYAATMIGQSALALKAARQAVGLLQARSRRNASPYTQLYLVMPLEVLMRFGRWDEILAEPVQPDAPPFVQALHHAARGVSLAARGELSEARAEEARFRAARALVPADWAILDTSGAAILDVADHLLRGELSLREARVEPGLLELRAAVEAEDALGYKEPPLWITPTRHALGAALLRHERAAEAEAVFREDLRRLPGNGWSLLGLGQALRLQQRPREAEDAEARFAAAWSGADVTIDSPCYCQSRR
jgi:tetratricopeptide (TPR) repeat protein